MISDQLRARFPHGTTVVNGAGRRGHVDGLAAFPGGVVAYVTWTASRYTDKGEPVPWREAVAADSIIPIT